MLTAQEIRLIIGVLMLLLIGAIVTTCRGPQVEKVEQTSRK